MHRLLRAGLIAVLFVPLIFGTSLLYPFVVYRTYFFYILVDLCLALFVFDEQAVSGLVETVRSLRTSRVEVHGLALLLTVRDKTYGRSFRMSRLAFHLLTFFLIMIATDILAPHPWAGIFGNYERMMGILTVVHLALYLLMTLAVFRSRRDFFILIQWFAGVGSAVSVYGILQHAGIAFRISNIDERLLSTVGNPAFLAGCLLFSFSFCLMAFVNEKQSAWKALWIVLSVANFAALYETGTRGALLGLAVSGVFVFLSFLVSFLHAKNKKMFWSVGIGVLVMVFAGALLARDTSNVTMRRITGATFSDTSILDRVFLWQSAFLVTRPRWFFGVGSQNVRAALDRVYTPHIAEAWYDSTHNVFLDILLAYGTVGLYAYILTGCLLMAATGKRLKSHREECIFLRGALIAYGIQAFFIFDTLVVLLPLFLVMGYVMVPDEEDTNVAASVPLPNLSSIRWIAVLGVIGIFVFGYGRGVRALSGVTHGLRDVESGASLANATNDFSNGLSFAYFGYGNLASIIRDATDKAILAPKGTYDPRDVASLLDLMDKAHALARDHEGATSQLWSDPAKVYLDMRPPKKPLLDRGMMFLDRAIGISPKRIDLYFAKAETLYEGGNANAAEQLLQGIASGFPDQRGEIYFRIALLQETHASAEVVLQEFSRAASAGKAIPRSEYEMLATRYVRKESWSDAVQVFRAMLEDDRNDARTLSNLAQSYKRMGDKNAARETALRLAEANPAFKDQVKAFIDSL